jgi:hypothetical protein
MARLPFVEAIYSIAFLTKTCLDVLIESLALIALGQIVKNRGKRRVGSVEQGSLLVVARGEIALLCASLGIRLVNHASFIEKAGSQANAHRLRVWFIEYLSRSFERPDAVRSGGRVGENFT